MTFWPPPQTQYPPHTPLLSFHMCIPAMPWDTWEDAPDLPSNLLPRPWTMT